MAEQTSNKKTISNLTQDNLKLQARIKQLQKGLGQRKTNLSDESESVNDSQEFHAVDKLIDHKKTRTGIRYLVRWEVYSPKDDTWVEESNLHCPQLLDEYKRIANLE